ncbi:hypothetical protein LTR36_000382 [Oleoguttula mirabilis]|uniref:Uncharacterized protein n=1 Tax=Oleoguttula mirabilis TaxID=1507867 RepID=A0AAV9K034_9PEZI|nr:hypothetical protein LTR36_000382 [Oleoguttula mirabilis]
MDRYTAEQIASKGTDKTKQEIKFAAKKDAAWPVGHPEPTTKTGKAIEKLTNKLEKVTIELR